MNWFEQMAAKGRAPSLIYDDNGMWAVAEDGEQNIRTQDTDDLYIGHMVSASAFCETFRDAIDAAIAHENGTEESLPDAALPIREGGKGEG